MGSRLLAVDTLAGVWERDEASGAWSSFTVFVSSGRFVAGGNFTAAILHRDPTP